MGLFPWGRSVATGPARAATLVLSVFLIAMSHAGGVPTDEWTITFEEVSKARGIEMQAAGEIHDPGQTDGDWPAFPEITGVGACWADFTGDGHDDLYVANQRYNDMNPYARGFNDLFDPTNRYYVNDGDGSFTDRTQEAGVQSRTFDFGCSGVDFDADGHVDLLVYGFGHVKLYRNDGVGAFQEVTEQAGLDVSDSCLPYACWTSCSAWVDYDGDGWLDLFVCTFVESDMEDTLRGPADHVAQLNFLFRNNGNGTFTEVAQQAGVAGIAEDDLGSKSWGAVWFDADLDGWPDLYVANDMTPNEFYWNQGDGTFVRDDDAGLYDSQAGMGVTAGDSDGNGHPDLYFTHYLGQHNGYYVNRGDGTFADHSGRDELSNDWGYVGWGARFSDLDRDGRLDVVAANGHTEWGVSSYDQATLVFHQEPQGDGTTKWVDRTSQSGPGVLEERVSRGAAFADHDLDGDVDVLVGNNANQSVQFLEGAGNGNHWFYVQPVQGGPNHQAIGARVVVEAGGLTQSREVHAGSSFLSQDSLLADFGLGDAGQVDRLTVHWPHGGTTVLEGLPADRVVRVDRETGSYVTDTLSPLTKAAFDGELTKKRWFDSDVEVALVAEDRAVGPVSGLAWTQLRLDEEAWKEYDGGTMRFSGEGMQYTLRFRSMDETGNLEPVRTERFGIDRTPPVVEHHVQGTPASNGWWLDAELVVQADDASSGVDEVLYRVDGGDWSIYTQPVPLDEGVHLLEYKATDKAGNGSPVGDVTVKVDSSPPQVSLLKPQAGGVYIGDQDVAGLGGGPAVVVGTGFSPGSPATEFTITIASSDPVSGVDRLSLLLNGEPLESFHSPDEEEAWVWDTAQEPAGTYLLQAVALDRAGNVEAATRPLVLVVVTQEGATNTVTEGPSLYPHFEPGWWPVDRP